MADQRDRASDRGRDPHDDHLGVEHTFASWYSGEGESDHPAAVLGRHRVDCGGGVEEHEEHRTGEGEQERIEVGLFVR